MSIKNLLHVMVVDDTATSRGLMLQALDSMGLRNVQHAADGQEALAKLAAKPVHLVLSDYFMPGMDGLQLLQALRGEARTRGVGFVLVTGRAEQDLIDRGKMLGMNNFIRKPFTTPELKSCLEAVVGRF